jgi:hypothetical protein
VSIAGLHRAMERLGLEADGAWVRRDATRLTRPSKRQLEQIWESEQSIKGVARRLGVSPTTAMVWLADVRIFVSDSPAIRRSDLLAAIKAGKSIRRLEAGQSVGDAARAMGRTTSVVFRVAKRLGLR